MSMIYFLDVYSYFMTGMFESMLELNICHFNTLMYKSEYPGASEDPPYSLPSPLLILSPGLTENVTDLLTTWQKNSKQTDFNRYTASNKGKSTVRVNKLNVGAGINPNILLQNAKYCHVYKLCSLIPGVGVWDAKTGMTLFTSEQHLWKLGCSI